MNHCCADNDCGLRFENPAVKLVETEVCPRCGGEELIEARNPDERRIMSEKAMQAQVRKR